MLGATLQLVLLVMLTHKLKAGDYGRLALFASAYSLAITLFYNPWRHALLRFLPSRPQGRRRFLQHLLGGVTLSACITLLITLLVATTLPGNGLFLAALAIAVLAGGWVEINLEYFRRTLTPTSYARLFLSRSLMQLLFVAAGVWMDGTVVGAIAGLTASHLFAALATPLRDVWRGQWRMKSLANRMLRADLRSNMQKWLLYALPLTFAEFVSTAMVYTDRLMIAAFLGIADTGRYSAPHDLAWMGLHVMSLVAYLAFFPMVIEATERKEHGKRREALRNGFTLLFGLSLAATLGLVMLAHSLAGLALGTEYQDGAALLMQIIAVVHLIHALKVYWIDLAFSLHKKTWPLVLIGIFGILSNILFNAWLLPLHGIKGAAVATGLALLISTILSALVARKMHLADYPVCRTDLAKIFAAACCMGLVLAILPPAGNLPALMALVLVGAGTFLTVLWKLQLSMLADFPSNRNNCS